MLHTNHSVEYVFHYSTPFWGMQLDFLCFVSRSVVCQYSSLCKLSGTLDNLGGLYNYYGTVFSVLQVDFM